MRLVRACHWHWLAGSVVFASLMMGSSSLAAVGLAQVSSAAERSVWDGVYTTPQAKQGTAIYIEKCSACHDEGVKAPDLAGPDFLGEWADKSLGVLYSRMLTTMPADVPGSLKEREVLDLTAYILQANRFPPGDRQLDNVAALDNIKFGSKP